MSDSHVPPPAPRFDRRRSLIIDRLILQLDRRPRGVRRAVLRVQKRLLERRVMAFVSRGCP